MLEEYFYTFSQIKICIPLWCLNLFCIQTSVAIMWFVNPEHFYIFSQNKICIPLWCLNFFALRHQPGVLSCEFLVTSQCLAIMWFVNPFMNLHYIWFSEHLITKGAAKWNIYHTWFPQPSARGLFCMGLFAKKGFHLCWLVEVLITIVAFEANQC